MANPFTSTVRRARSKLAGLIAPGGTLAPSSAPPKSSELAPLPRSASGNPYSAASTTRRNVGWQPTRLGPTTSLWGTRDLMLARCRDEVRNNPWAASAVDNFESQVIGNGIKPHWNINIPGRTPDQNAELKIQIESEFKRWAIANCFYGMQATACREIFEAGEVFCRRYIRPSSWKLRIPLELQLIEAEQVPIFLNTITGGQPGTPANNSIRTGIEFDPYNRITAYHMYKEHPGETMFYPLEGLTFTRIPATDICHAFKPARAGLLRGQPHLSSVLATLHELDKYMDAAVVKKQIQTMFAAFITKVDPGSDVLPVDSTIATAGNEMNQAPSANAANFNDLGTAASRLETGTVQELLTGEDIKFPTLPQDSDIETFLRVCLHQFAMGIGATYEQVTGDLKDVNLSSIRAGILDFRRKCEQFQYNVIVGRFIYPIVCKWWLPEAVMAGVLDLPGYADDPGLYEDIDWGMPGWPWIDPLKDVQAKQMEVRSGFESREAVVAERGGDVATVDAQQTVDNKRADSLKLVYDSDARLTLSRGEKVTAEGAKLSGGNNDDEQGDKGSKDDSFGN